MKMGYNRSKPKVQDTGEPLNHKRCAVMQVACADKVIAEYDGNNYCRRHYVTLMSGIKEVTNLVSAGKQFMVIEV
jgi:hypothetical protein